MLTVLSLGDANIVNDLLHLTIQIEEIQNNKIESITNDVITKKFLKYMFTNKELQVSTFCF